MSDRRDFLQLLLAGALTTDASRVLAQQTPSDAAAAKPGARIVHRQPLPSPFDGLDAAFVEVTIPPGVDAPPHRHSGFVLGYVMEGEFRFGTDGETPRIVRAGETFYEPPGAVHSTGASARPDRPVKLLAIVIGKQGAVVTTYGQ